MRIAFVTSRFPFPVEKGDKLRAFHQIRLLSRDHEVHLISISHKKISETDLEAMKPYCHSVKIFQINKWLLPFNLLIGMMESMPLQVSYFLDRTIKRQVQYHIISIEPDHIICQLIRAAAYVRALPFPKTLDYMDVFSEGMRQLSLRYKWIGIFFKMEAYRLAAYERTIYKDFDSHIIISAQDRERLKLPTKDFIKIVPNGVDDRFFSAQGHHAPLYDLVFVGNLGYGPNIDAAKFLVNQLLPALRKKQYNLSILIAGARPARTVKSLSRHPNVTVQGWVPDIRDAYRNGRIFVAPMLSGLGLQNKILEAMSMGLPCITTTLVNNAIGAIENEQILIADTLDGFVNRIIYLFENPGVEEKLATNGKVFVNSHYQWEHQVKKLEEVMHTKNTYLSK